MPLSSSLASSDLPNVSGNFFHNETIQSASEQHSSCLLHASSHSQSKLHLQQTSMVISSEELPHLHLHNLHHQSTAILSDSLRAFHLPSHFLCDSSLCNHTQILRNM
ncbi:hypothetical protein V6Z12_A05G441300 [Gossypium hirsutum]